MIHRMYKLEDCDWPPESMTDDADDGLTYTNNTDKSAEQLRHGFDLQRTVKTIALQHDPETS